MGSEHDSSTSNACAERPLADRLLALMDQKHHWAYPALTRPGLSRAQLLEHFRHEYLVYVRDFPVLLARALGQVPPLDDVRRALAENLYEEQTGGISKSAPHPELFLRMMEGLGYSRASFVDDEASLHPAARAYRDLLREASARAPWQAAVALLTIFVEGSVHERKELAGKHERRVDGDGDAAIARHPLVLHYGCPPSAMQLTRAHAAVEGAHRGDAWRIVLAHVPDDGETHACVIDLAQRALASWHRYRDGVADRMELRRDASAA
jgi:pyrroloquinoline quinone (PQQ) biosynthesis protein C